MAGRRIGIVSFPVLLVRHGAVELVSWRWTAVAVAMAVVVVVVGLTCP